jgi:hypothetical protein
LRSFLQGAEAGNDGNILDLEKSPAPPANLEHVVSASRVASR